MQPDREQRIRAHAYCEWRQGLPGWDRELRMWGLDPYTWSTGGRTMIPAPATPHMTRRAPGQDVLVRAASLGAQSFDEATNTVEVLWSTGTGVQRYAYPDGAYLEVLEMTASAVRLGRLNAGASFLNSHSSSDLGDVIGSVVPNSARILGGKGTCRVLLAESADCADVVSKIRTGVIRNVSVGYVVHGITKTEAKGNALPVWRVTDWEPIEISAVAIPADPGAQIR